MPTSSQKVSSLDDGSVAPLTISTIFNAKIAQAISLCKNDKVTFDKNLKVYHCIQESKVFMINLLPEEKCTCIEKKGCSHILAVKHYNGYDIKKLYKTPLLSQLTVNKNNNNKSGSKFKNHR